MAAGLIRARVHAAGLADRVTVASAGVAALPGFAAMDESIAQLAARDIDISGHRSQPVTAALLDQADLVLVMEEAHRQTLARRAPHQRDKVRLFPELIGHHGDVADPVGGSPDDYRRTVEELDTILAQGWGALLAALPLDVLDP